VSAAHEPPRPPDERSLASTRLLTDLVANTLDPGYAAAAERRAAGTPRGHWYARPAAAAGLVLIGFLLVTAYIHTHRGAPLAQQAHDRLVERVRAAQRTVAHLSGELTTAEASLAVEQAQALPSSGALAQRLDQLQVAAGQVAVAGPGLVVTLREPPAPTSTAASGRGGSTPLSATSILTDRDVRSVVNELWHDGAEAISVNDIRLTATSAIRFAGEAVLVDFQPIMSPYVVRAIGNSDDLSTTFAESAVASRYQTLVSADGIGFSFDNSDRLTLPASGAVTPRYASALPSPQRSGK
jgi:uncharacterized protein YlxW (UPF0749 family)